MLSLELLCSDLLGTMIQLLELRNPFNVEHCRLVTDYCDKLALHVGLPEERRALLLGVARIHTLGVLLQMEEKQRSLPLRELNQGGPRDLSILQREERIIRSLLDPLPQFQGGVDILLQRHEWYDGSGSVLGFCGQGILPEARLLAVVDAFVDLATPKAHRPPVSTPQVLEQIRQQRGTQFDPFYVDALEQVVGGDSSWPAWERARQFERQHCRHYLSLGHFYGQIHEQNWALRSYAAAERLALKMKEPGLQLGAISGQFMVFCDQGQLERARATLHRVRSQSRSPADQLGYQLLWGLLECLSGQPLGQEILARVGEEYARLENLPGQTAALAFRACMLLFSGADEAAFREVLERFLEMLARHDVFDVVERYRPYTIPVLLSAIVHDVHQQLARNLLTRLGEPCQGALLQQLREAPPSRWTQILMPESVIPEFHLPEAAATDATHPCLEIETLGRLRFTCAGRAQGMDDWQTLKVVRLFLRLALASGPLSGEVLSEEFWPEAEPEKARNSLRNALSQVRRSLRTLLADPKAEVLCRDRKGDQVSLLLTCVFDFQRFETALERAQAAFQASDLGEARKQVAQALNLYGGDFLQNFYEEEFEARRVRLRELKWRALALVTQVDLAEGDCESAEMTARELVSLDDLREESHVLLLRALGGAGRSAQAVAHYEQAVDLFEREIGVVPARLKAPLVELGLIL